VINTPYDTYNAAYVQSLYDLYLQNPLAVDDAWRRFFEEGGAAALGAPAVAAPATAPAAGAPAGASTAQLRAARAFGELVDAYRLNGHYAAHLDPLGSPPRGHPMLEPEFHGVTEEEIATIPLEAIDEELQQYGRNAVEVLDFIRQTYTGTIGYEYEHLEHPEATEWLREQIESGAHRQPLSKEEKKRLLRRLTEVEAFEQFLHKSYLGAKRFSIEGNDMMVPMLDLAIERSAAAGGREVVIGMAHRGRLNTLTHVLGMPYKHLIAKFEDKYAHTGGTGDVKYHLGFEGTYATASGEPLSVVLAPNPSHLEFIDAVIVGMARAKQTDRSSHELRRDEAAVLPVQIHGDAAFSGQGVVPETLNLSRLRGYRVGGSLHIIANNQVGFTTNPSDARSTIYSSDVARGFDIPIFHVNADDPEACLAVARLALMYREKFRSDVVIDLIGYRRYGHNEADEPLYTQPILYSKIPQHPTVRKLLADELVRSGVLSTDEVEAMWRSAYDRLVQEQAEVKSAPMSSNGDAHAHRNGKDGAVKTAVSRDRLVQLDRELHHWPSDFTVNPKLARQLEKRSHLVQENGNLEWAHAEALAFASLLTEAVPIRMTGQDVERGTFSQRHLVLHDSSTGAKYTPMQHIPGARAPFEIYNSPLSELAVVGFEYGFSVVAPEALVLWEAQFGDFVNGAQVIIDQFISAGRAKWDQESRLVLLLPHGQEGQGPEHSSSRLERFLQLCAEDNMRVANCTTPAQYFHLLRRQALLHTLRPLIVATPKSLLRHPRATSKVDELVSGRFEPVLKDTAGVQDPASVLLCTGKIYYELEQKREETSANVAILRVEELYPFPILELKDALARYSPAEVVWVQEEPENMGAWSFVQPRLREVLPESATLRYVGRPERASPAEGYARDHAAEQARIVSEAFASAKKPRSSKKK